MRIVEVITSLGAGGAERFVVDLCNELAKENEIYLLTILDDQIDSVTRTFYLDAVSPCVKYINLGLPNGFKWKSQNLVVRTICKIQPDIVHYHMVPTLKYSGLAILLLSFKFKTFFTVHSDLHNGYDKGFVNILCNTLSRFNKFHLVCLSQKNYLDFKNFYNKISARCIVNGRAPILPTDQYECVRQEVRQLKMNPDSILFIHVARCHPVKNQSLLVNAFNLIVDKGYNADLIIIGALFDSKDGVKLQSMANSRIHFLGVKKNVSDYLLSSDIFCLSSDFEGMPITLIEASLAGLPSVSTPVCGAVDLIKDGINGCISKEHTIESYASALIKAYESFDLLKKHANTLKNHSPYTISECAFKYIEFFKS